MKFEWEKICATHSYGVGGSNTHRSKVIGGWVLSLDAYTDVICKGNERTLTSSMCFIPDPNHEWTIDE